MREDNKQKIKTKINNSYQWIIMILLVLSIATTVMSVAKYQLSRSTSQEKIFTTPSFYFQSDLTQTQIIQEGAGTVKKGLDSKIDFHIQNYVYDNTPKKLVNEESITYTVTLTGSSNLVLMNNGAAVAGNHVTTTMSAKTETDTIYQVWVDQLEPGTYSGVVEINVTSPYQKKIVQNVSLVLSDFEQSACVYNSGINWTETTINCGAKNHDVTISWTPNFGLYQCLLNGESNINISNGGKLSLQAFDTVIIRVVDKVTITATPD